MADRCLTEGALNLLSGEFDDVHPRESGDASEQSDSLGDNVIAMLRNGWEIGSACVYMTKNC
jgi:hypothetical protein